MPPFEVVVTSPCCANSALLLVEVTLISLIPSTEGKSSLRGPLERTEVEEMPSMVNSFWAILLPASVIRFP